MASFKGKNSLGTVRAFEERLKYSIDAFPLNASGYPYPSGVKDFSFAENRLYGRVSTAHQAISANEANMTPVKEGRGNVMALDFVAAAFEGFVREFQKASLAGKLDADDPYLYKISAKKGFVSNRALYEVYNLRLRAHFVEKYLTPEMEDSIADFESFVPIFADFARRVSVTRPITRGNFLVSNFCSSLVTGLTIYLLDLDASDDSEKEKFLKSKNYRFFYNAAVKHGFSIDKSVPWRLTADISSPAMLRYAATFGRTSTRQILNTCFAPVYGYDLKDLRIRAMEFYNAFVATKPRRVRNVNGGREYTCRRPITLGALLSEEIYGLASSEKYWLDMYIDIRYNEHQKPASPGGLRAIKKIAINLFETSLENGILAPTERAVAYINTAFRGFDNYNGSFAQLYLKDKSRNLKRPLQPTY